MSAPLTSALAPQQMPTTQMLQPTSLDQTRNVERKEPSPQEYQIQAVLEPSSQSQASNSTGDNAMALSTIDIVKFIMEIKEMQKTGEMPSKGAVLDLHA